MATAQPHLSTHTRNCALHPRTSDCISEPATQPPAGPDDQPMDVGGRAQAFVSCRFTTCRLKDGRGKKRVSVVNYDDYWGGKPYHSLAAAAIRDSAWLSALWGGRAVPCQPGFPVTHPHSTPAVRHGDVASVPPSARSAAAHALPLGSSASGSPTRRMDSETSRRNHLGYSGRPRLLWKTWAETQPLCA